MKNYTLSELADPATYEADGELATLVRRKVAPAHHKALGVGIGDFKRAALSGAYPELVAEAVQEQVKISATAQKKNADAEEAAQSLIAPDGYTLARSDEILLLKGPFDEDLHARIKRIGGHWDGANQGGRQCWVIPVAKAKSLSRVFTNWVKQAGPDKAAQRKKEKALLELARWLGYVEEKAVTGYLYQKGIDTLNTLGVSDHPELAQRLKVACDQAKHVRAEQERQWAAEKVAQRQAQQAARKPASPRALFPLSHVPPMDTPVRYAGAAVVFTGVGKAFVIDEDAPSLYGSQLLGYEGEWGRYAYYREASDTEIAELTAHEEQAQRERDAAAQKKAALHALREKIQTEGERPEGSHPMDGQLLHDTRTIYGGGECFMITDAHIWHIQNNGADGDDWRRNNVVTSGAGAIGTRVPYSHELAEKLKAIASVQPTAKAGC